jgi:membrane-bound lytic murein transglycosylase B
MTELSRPATTPAAGRVIRVERFEYASAELLLRLSVRLSRELPSPASPTLFVRREAVEHEYSPLLACTGRAPLKDAEEWLWRGAFAIPPDVIADPLALYAVQLREDLLLELPSPTQLPTDMQSSRRRDGSRRAWPYAVRRSALLFVVTCQLCLAPAWSTGALADGAPGVGSSESTPETPPQPPAGGAGEATPETPAPPPAGGSGEPPAETPAKPPSGGSGEATPETPPREGGTGHSSTTTSTTPTPAPTDSPAVTTVEAPTKTPVRKPALDAKEVPRVALQRKQETTAAGKVNHVAAAHPQPTTGGAKSPKHGAPSVANNVAPAPQVVAAEARALAAELAASGATNQALAFYRIPPFLLPIYQAAAVQYGVPWQILAAINEIETDYGSDLSVSSAGAVGWMQFMPATWLQYGVDALNAGYADPYNPVDAIFAAARYLRAAGATSNLRAAILSYNHSDAYVGSVLLRAELIAAYPKSVIGTLTGLIDAGLPVTGKQLAWELLGGAASPLSAAGYVTMQKGHEAGIGLHPATPGSSAPPPPAVAAAAAPGTAGAPARPLDMVDLRSARNAAVVAVQDGRILQRGSSRRLGNYLVLRDIYGNVFTYAGLGSIAQSFAPPEAAATSVDRANRRSRRPDRLLPLRVGSVVRKGTVLGHVLVPSGARDGHLHFAIRPAGDANTIDPSPILANWTQLSAALHPQGAKGESNLLGATTSVPKVGRSASAGRNAPSQPVVSGELTVAQWDQLIARITRLPVPKVAVTPSAAAIPDPGPIASNAAPGSGPLSSGG